MKPENTEMKLVFVWLVSDITFLLPGGLNLLHKLFTVCCCGYNILVKYWFLPNPRLKKKMELNKFDFMLRYNLNVLYNEVSLHGPQKNYCNTGKPKWLICSDIWSVAQILIYNAVRNPYPWATSSNLCPWACGQWHRLLVPSTRWSVLCT